MIKQLVDSLFYGSIVTYILHRYSVSIIQKRKAVTLCNDLNFLYMGWMTGLEPASAGATIRCVDQLRHIHHRLN